MTSRTLTRFKKKDADASDDGSWTRERRLEHEERHARVAEVEVEAEQRLTRLREREREAEDKQRAKRLAESERRMERLQEREARLEKLLDTATDDRAAPRRCFGACFLCECAWTVAGASTRCMYAFLRVTFLVGLVMMAFAGVSFSALNLYTRISGVALWRPAANVSVNATPWQNMPTMTTNADIDADRELRKR